MYVYVYMLCEFPPSLTSGMELDLSAVKRNQLFSPQVGFVTVIVTAIETHTKPWACFRFLIVFVFRLIKGTSVRFAFIFLRQGLTAVLYRGIGLKLIL